MTGVTKMRQSIEPFTVCSRRIGLIACVALFAALALGCSSADGKPHVTEQAVFETQKVSAGLEHPWSVAFLPDGDFLVTERAGRLRRITADGELIEPPIAGVPAVYARGQGGLLDVVLHPEFESNRLVDLSYSEPGPGGGGTAVARGRLNDDRLEDVEVLFRLDPKTRTTRHFGSRLVFAPDGRLFVMLGDRGKRERAQRLDDHIGTIVRLEDDGRIPVDNPFLADQSVRPEIYSYGHRNLQGATLHPETGALWTHEHGPQGGDEINLPLPAVNHGWPVITYGVNYGIGTAIGEGTAKPGMAQPLYYWDPSIAPSGMAFYSGPDFPEWAGDLFIGSLKFSSLVRLEIEGERIIAEERMLTGELGRIRDVRQGPDGHLYVLTDARNGALIRLVPVGG